MSHVASGESFGTWQRRGELRLCLSSCMKEALGAACERGPEIFPAWISAGLEARSVTLFGLDHYQNARTGFDSFLPVGTSVSWCFLTKSGVHEIHEDRVNEFVSKCCRLIWSLADSSHNLDVFVSIRVNSYLRYLQTLTLIFFQVPETLSFSLSKILKSDCL
jgi:hypothetical protein